MMLHTSDNECYRLAIMIYKILSLNIHLLHVLGNHHVCWDKLVQKSVKVSSATLTSVNKFQRYYNSQPNPYINISGKMYCFKKVIHNST